MYVFEVFSNTRGFFQNTFDTKLKNDKTNGNEMNLESFQKVSRTLSRHMNRPATTKNDLITTSTTQIPIIKIRRRLFHY